MKQLTAALAAVALLALSSCGKQDPTPPPPSSPGGPVGARPEKLANGEPSVITVKHVLVAFEGATRSEQKRTRAEAQKLAYEILGRAKSGEDFDKLMKEFSNDPGGGTYTMTNKGVDPNEGAGEMGRENMVPAFGDVGFRITVNEIAVAEYDATASPFGWHVIKRVK